MHGRLWNFEEITYDDYDLYNILKHRDIDYINELPENNWLDDIEYFIKLHTLRGLPISRNGNEITFKYNDLKAYFEKHEYDLAVIYDYLYTETDEGPTTEYDWVKNLLEDFKGHEIITLVIRQIFDYHF